MPEYPADFKTTVERLVKGDPEPSAIFCGSSTCPTCGRPTEALIGPCDGCDESFRKTGRFLRSVSRKSDQAVTE